MMFMLKKYCLNFLPYQPNSEAYVNLIGKSKMYAELHRLRSKLDSKWHDKLNALEEIISNPSKFVIKDSVSYW